MTTELSWADKQKRAIEEAVRTLRVERWRADYHSPWREGIIKGMIRSHNNRARALGLGGRVSYDEWMAVCGFYRGRCLRCGLDCIILSMDHITPLSLGGQHSVSNLQPLCQHCQLVKARRSWDFRPHYI